MRALLLTLAIFGAIQANSQENVCPTPVPAPLPIGGCAPEDFVDVEENVIRVVGMSYSPKCARVKVGDSLSIQASTGHPLQGVEGRTCATNPVVSIKPITTINTFVFLHPGTFGYFCMRHGSAAGDGMSGAIQVIE